MRVRRALQAPRARLRSRVPAVCSYKYNIRLGCQVRAEERCYDTPGPEIHGLGHVDSWRDLVRTLWAAAGRDAFANQQKAYADSLVEAVNRLNRSSEERLSVRLGLSLTQLAHRLDATKDVLDILPIDFRHVSFRDLVGVASLLAEVSVVDVGFLEALSQGIEDGGLDSLRPDEMVVFLNSLAGINWQGSQRQKACVTMAALRNGAYLNASASVGLLHILARAPRGRAEDLEAASAVVLDLMNDFTMKQLGIAAKAYGRLVSREVHALGRSEALGARSMDLAPRSMLEKIASHAAKCVDGADPKDLVRLIQAFQAAGLRPEGLLDVLDVWADKRLAAMNASGISLAMTHFARVGEASPRLLKTAVKVAEANVESLTPSETSKLVWAFAHLQYDPGQILLRKGVRVLEREGYVHLDETEPHMSDRELANLFWGLVRLEQYPSAQERRNIAIALNHASGKLSGQSAAILLWSFASSQETAGGSRHNDSAFNEAMYRLGMDLCADAASVDSQSISMTAWSLGVLKIKHPEFAACLDSLTMGYEGKLLAFEPQHVANLVWGLAKSGSRPSPEFMLEVNEALSGRMSMYSPQELFNICWGYATMGFASKDVASETLTELKIRGSEFGGLELSGISWALSRMLKNSNDASIASQSSRIIQIQLAKHVQDLEPSQLAMSVVGVARLSVGGAVDVDEVLMSELIGAFCESFRGELQPTISSLNTLLEGLALLRERGAGPVPQTDAPSATQAVEATLRADNNLQKCLEKARFWEVCDLCYYMGQNDMPLAKGILIDHIEGTIASEMLTPRGATMLLKTMRRYNVYPPVTLDKATSKIAALSPNYRLGERWLAILREVLSVDEEISQRVTFQHAVWDDRVRSSTPGCTSNHG